MLAGPVVIFLLAFFAAAQSTHWDCVFLLLEVFSTTLLLTVNAPLASWTIVIDMLTRSAIIFVVH